MKITFDDVSFKYDKETPNVLSNASFTINSGELTAIIGKNGSGKSTIAKLIVGLLTQDSGNIYIDDTLLTEKSSSALLSRMGMVFQNPDNQFVASTVKDDIAFGLENRCIVTSLMKEKINKYARMVRMEEFLEKSPEELSGGQKQRVALAGVLALETDLIIMDEATSMLDPEGVKEINEIIKELKKNFSKTIITVTHNLQEIVYADNVLVLDGGRVVASGTPKEILLNTDLLEKVGLEVIDAVKLIKRLSKSTITNKKEWEDEIWDLAFKM